jgi:glycosyltransferase involved in cell wall biosynthesis
MTIWIVNHYAAPPSRAGGTRHYSLLRELIRRGHSGTIFASSFDHITRREVSLEPGERCRVAVEAGVPFVWVRTPGYSGNTAARLWNMLVFTGRVWAKAGMDRHGRPDVILGSSPHLFAALAAYRCARRYQIPFVLEVRDLWPESLVELGQIPRYHPVVMALGRIERFLYERADRIISLLPSALEYIRGRGGDWQKVVHIPNGVALDLIPMPEPPPAREMFTLMYAGAHGQANGLDTLLDAAILLNREGWQDKLSVRLLGDGPERGRLEGRVRSEQMRNVSIEGPIAKENVFHILEQADACILILRNASIFRYGISPNKLFDYMAAGRPVILSVNSMNNPVEEAGAGFTLAPEDPKALAECIKRLAGLSPVERWEMGMRGRRYVEQHHSVARLAGQLELTLAAMFRRPAQP